MVKQLDNLSKPAARPGSAKKKTQGPARPPEGPQSVLVTHQFSYDLYHIFLFLSFGRLKAFILTAWLASSIPTIVRSTKSPPSPPSSSASSLLQLLKVSLSQITLLSCWMVAMRGGRERGKEGCTSLGKDDRGQLGIPRLHEILNRIQSPNLNRSNVVEMYPPIGVLHIDDSGDVRELGMALFPTLDEEPINAPHHGCSDASSFIQEIGDGLGARDQVGEAVHLVCDLARRGWRALRTSKVWKGGKECKEESKGKVESGESKESFSLRMKHKLLSPFLRLQPEESISDVMLKVVGFEEFNITRPPPSLHLKLRKQQTLRVVLWVPVKIRNHSIGKDQHRQCGNNVSAYVFLLYGGAVRAILDNEIAGEAVGANNMRLEVLMLSLAEGGCLCSFENKHPNCYRKKLVVPHQAPSSCQAGGGEQTGTGPGLGIQQLDMDSEQAIILSDEVENYETVRRGEEAAVCERCGEGAGEEEEIADA
ncbi:hypothetical protein BDK51DRAFT_26134 [Blyttiomyces helicus]|uniref:Uncharacterized protein n=1 Tax=Blyttiomyces helicus TaxID=388810 RepID=A0A4P9WJN1_9FUNG|nr:hypothetical protein BDK51DRAFT_26134 [Blyttiomyces helicus]|eukprot:RKO91350.1 hypothetical protein BDK51DRAFT_26134 [Blyttiomyces helicus]